MENRLKNYFRNYVFLFSIAGIVVILDQWTKYLVRTNLEVSEMWAPWDWLLPYARIVHWHNTGAAFGMFQQFSIVFTLLAIVVAGAIIYYFPKVPRTDWIIRVALSLQLGGAIGNLIDRLSRGSVTDFVSVGNFAVWNVADASIFVGTIVLIIGMWLKERSQEADQTDQISEPEGSPKDSLSNPGTDE